MATPDLQSQLVSQIRPTILILTAAVGFVLLIACANVASLLLSRALGRKKEFAVRTALGFLGTRVLAGLSEDNFWMSQVSMDPRVLTFTLAISILSGVLFGLAPSLELSKTDVNRALRDEGRGSTGSLRRNRARGVLVVGQVALSMILLVGAGLLIRSFVRLRTSPAGFDPNNVLTMLVTLMPSHYSQPAQMTQYYRNALERVQ